MDPVTILQLANLAAQLTTTISQSIADERFISSGQATSDQITQALNSIQAANAALFDALVKNLTAAAAKA